MTLSPVTYDPERSKGNPVKLVPNATTAASWLCLVSMGPNKAQSTALICIDVAGGRLLILSLPSRDLKELPLIDLKGMARGSHNLLKITFKQETILVLAEDEQQLGEIARFAALSPACQMPMSFIPLAFTCIRSFRDIKISSRGTKGAASDPSTILAFDTRRVSLTLLQWSLKFAFADTGDESTAQEWNLDEICGLQLNEDTRDSSDRDVLRLDFEKDQCVVVSCARTQAHRCFVTLLMARVLLLRMGLWPEMRIAEPKKDGDWFTNPLDEKDATGDDGRDDARLQRVVCAADSAYRGDVYVQCTPQHEKGNPEWQKVFVVVDGDASNLSLFADESCSEVVYETSLLGAAVPLNIIHAAALSPLPSVEDLFGVFLHLKTSTEPIMLCTTSSEETCKLIVAMSRSSCPNSFTGKDDFVDKVELESSSSSDQSAVDLLNDSMLPRVPDSPRDFGDTAVDDFGDLRKDLTSNRMLQGDDDVKHALGRLEASDPRFAHQLSAALWIGTRASPPPEAVEMDMAPKQQRGQHRHRQVEAAPLEVPHQEFLGRHEAPQQRAAGREDDLEKIRHRLKAAAYTQGGVDVESLFKTSLDVNHDGRVDIDEFLSAVRRRLHIPTSEISDDEVEAIFAFIDKNSSETIELEEIVAFLRQGKRWGGYDDDEQNARSIARPAVPPTRPPQKLQKNAPDPQAVHLEKQEKELAEKIRRRQELLDKLEQEHRAKEEAFKDKEKAFAQKELEMQRKMEQLQFEKNPLPSPSCSPSPPPSVAPPSPPPLIPETAGAAGEAKEDAALGFVGSKEMNESRTFVPTILKPKVEVVTFDDMVNEAPADSPQKDEAHEDNVDRRESEDEDEESTAEDGGGDGDGNDDESDLHLGHEWVQGYDKNHGHYYYFNVKTKESRWDAPEEYLPHVESSEEEEESD